MRLLLRTLGLALLTSAAAVAARDAAAPPPLASQRAPAALASPGSQRPPEERLALARRFLALVMPEDTTLQDMRDMSNQAIESGAAEDEGDSDRDWTRRFMDRVIVKAAPIIRDHMLSIREVTAFVYAREFSSAELQDMIAFAQTPAGKHYWAREHFLDLDPSVVAQEQLLREAMRPVYFEVRKEMCQEATAKRVAAGDKKAKCPLSQEHASEQG